MSKRKYKPNYAELYPGVDISDDVLEVLKQSDRKMEYMEYDLKAERPLRAEDGIIIGWLPSREDSLERLLESNHQFKDDSPDPEAVVMEQTEILELYRALAHLEADERALIDMLFFSGSTERKCSATFALSKTAIHARKTKILDKLRNFLFFLDVL